MFRFKVMPFGPVNSPRTYSRMMKMTLLGAKNMDNFVDDTITYTSSDFSLHLESLRELCIRARQANVSFVPPRLNQSILRLNFYGL